MNSTRVSTFTPLRFVEHAVENICAFATTRKDQNHGKFFGISWSITLAFLEGSSKVEVSVVKICC